jgi:hypothetical protein
VLTFSDRGVSRIQRITNGRNQGFLHRSRYFFFQVALQLKEAVKITGIAENSTAVSVPLSQGNKISNEYGIYFLSLFAVDQDADMKPSNINLSNS